MALFGYTVGGDFDPNAAEIGYNSSISSDARTLVFGPGSSIPGQESFGTQFVYVLGIPGLNDTVLDFPLTSDAVGLYGDASDFAYATTVTGGDFGDVFRTGAGDDVLNGGNGNDVLEGGAGGDTINGGDGIDTASYANADAGVDVRLDLHLGAGGDALFDVLSSIENVTGSVHADNLYGDDGDNTLIGNGGMDYINGAGGDDRLVISETPLYVTGGAGTDILIIQSDSVVSGGMLVDIEAIYVRNDASLDLSDSLSGTKIVSQSTVGHGVEIAGASGVDRITAGKGSDTVHGEAGNDILKGGAGDASLFGDAGKDRITAGSGGATIDGGEDNDSSFGGAGEDTFSFSTDYGRDNIYKFEIGKDHLDISGLGLTFADVNIKSVHGGHDTQVTFDGIDGTQKIILHDVVAASLTSDDFLFGG